MRVACVQTRPPLPSVKIGEGAPSPIFTEWSGGLVCTQAKMRAVCPWLSLTRGVGGGGGGGGGKGGKDCERATV